MAFKFPTQLILVYICTFIDALGYSFVIPILPYFLEQVGGSSSDLGLLTSIYAITQGISAFVMGALSDRYGRKPYIILSLFGSFTGPIFQALSPNVIVFFIARGYTGLLGGSQTVCQAYIGDIVPPEQRSTYLAYTMALVGTSYVIGPLLGGFLSSVSLVLPFYVCGAIAFIVMVISWWLVKETNQKVLRTSQLKAQKKKLLKKTALNEEESQSLEKIQKELKAMTEESKGEKPKLKWNKYIFMADLQRFFNDSQVCVFATLFSQYMKDSLGSSSFDTSMIFVVTGVVTFLVQAAIYPFFHSTLHWSYITLSLIGGFAICVGWILMGLLPIVWVEYVSSCIMYFGFSLIAPVSPSLLSLHADAHTQGVALSTGVMSGQLAMIIVPIFASMFYEMNKTYTITLTSIFGVLIFIQMAIFACVPGGRNLEIPSYPEEPKEKEEEMTEKDVEEQKSEKPNEETNVPPVIVIEGASPEPNAISPEIDTNMVKEKETQGQ